MSSRTPRASRATPEKASPSTPRVEDTSEDVGLFARQAYLEYAMSVVKGRAIPYVHDGLKPVQRRILYAMHRLHLDHTAKPKKSARVVGDTLGQFHPHGDGATYEAMVRMAQGFTVRYPLIDGEGNFGSRDGDGPAAYRYTEARLMPIAEALLSELSWDTVDMVPNFDGTIKEPTVLPSRLPFLLMNGASGIAVGMATECPPHNLTEVVHAACAALEKPDCLLEKEEWMQHVSGPDYPTGSVCITPPEELAQMYAEGRGRIRLRARWTVEDQGKGRWRLAFSEVPHGTSSEKLMLEIDGLMNPKPKEKNGRKLPLTPEQERLKRLFTGLIAQFEDNSGKEYPVRLVVTPKDRSVEPEALALLLCAHTPLEGTQPVNMVAVDRDGTPHNTSMMAWLAAWCQFRIETVRRRLKDELARITHRVHILNGRLSILDRILEVIRDMTEAEDAKAILMSKYGLDEIQAEDVLEVRLRQLARLERVKLEKEKATGEATMRRLSKQLATEKALRAVIKEELVADMTKYGDARRTVMAPTAPATAQPASFQALSTATRVKEPVALALTERGWLAWRPAKSLEEAEQGEWKIRTGDTVRYTWFGDRSDTLLLLDAKGRGYSLSLTDLPSKADTAPLTTWFEPGAPLVEGVLSSTGEERYVLAGSGGYGFIIGAQNWISRKKAGKELLALDDTKDERPLVPFEVPADLATHLVAALAQDGRLVVFPLKDVKQIPKGKGVALMGGITLPACRLLALQVCLPEQALRFTVEGKAKPVTVPSEVWSGVLGPRSASKKGKRLAPVGARFTPPSRS